MTVFRAIILGLFQGITEFFPVSGSAHRILVPWFFKWPEPSASFDAFLHLGTLLAVFCYFASDWWLLIRAGIYSVIERRIGFDKERFLFWLIVLGSIPAGLSGFLFHDEADAVFHSPLIIAIMLATLGFLIYWIDGEFPPIKGLEGITFKDSVWIGLAQALAVIPGISRSGATMMMARLVGLNRESSARYSFLLSFPLLFAASAYEFRNYSEFTIGPGETKYLVVGFISAALFGGFSIHFLLRYLRNSDFSVFAWYRILLAGVIVLWSLLSSN